MHASKENQLFYTPEKAPSQKNNTAPSQKNNTDAARLRNDPIVWACHIILLPPRRNSSFPMLSVCHMNFVSRYKVCLDTKIWDSKNVGELLSVKTAKLVASG